MAKYKIDKLRPKFKIDKLLISNVIEIKEILEYNKIL